MFRSLMGSWQMWALGSAAFAALTAVFAKVGVAGIHSDMATLVRTVVILALVAAIAGFGGAWQPPGEIARKTWVFLVLSGLATGASWLCYFRALKAGDAARVAPVDKLSVVLVAVFGVIFLGEKLSLTAGLGVALIAAGAVLVAMG
ncbi:EamA family transporter [Xanthobacter autotrophicus DSM 431]|uniref:EamA family transporter n=1 Tax=Xanthobacter nonsaccharivorans TaxID=3119912 RepID=UPI00372A1F1A